MRRDVNKIREGIGDKIAGFLMWSSTCISGIIIGLVYGWKLALVTIALSPLLIVCGGVMTYVSLSRAVYRDFILPLFF